MEKLIYLEFFIAAGIRFCLFESNYNALLANRIEISTPVNSWKRGKHFSFAVHPLKQI